MASTNPPTNEMTATKFNKLVAKAYSLKNRNPIVRFFKGPSYDEAADTFTQASNLAKILKDYNAATTMLEEAANCFILADDKSGAATSYESAAATSRHDLAVTSLTSTRFYNAAIKLYEELGNFKKIAAIYRCLALDFEKEASTASSLSKKDTDVPCNNIAQEYNSALHYYEKALAILEAIDNSKSQQMDCVLSIYRISCIIGDYRKAITSLSRVISEYLDNNLLKFKTRYYIMKCIICYLAMDDVVAASKELEKYKSMDYTLENSREALFVEQLIQAVEQFDPDTFASSVAEFDKGSRLDPDDIKLLLAVKKGIKANVDTNVVQQHDDIDSLL